MYCSCGVLWTWSELSLWVSSFLSDILSWNSKNLCLPGLSALSLHLMKSPGLCLHFPSVSQLGNSFHPVSWGNRWTQPHLFFIFLRLLSIIIRYPNSWCPGKKYSKDKYKNKLIKNKGHLSSHWQETTTVRNFIKSTFLCIKNTKHFWYHLGFW